MKEWDERDADDVELSLLNGDERLEASNGYNYADVDDGYGGGTASKRPLSSKDKRAMVLLVCLCEYRSVSLVLFTHFIVRPYTGCSCEPELCSIVKQLTPRPSHSS
jgi:hypothetical protein